MKCTLDWMARPLSGSRDWIVYLIFVARINNGNRIDRLFYRLSKKTKTILHTRFSRDKVVLLHIEQELRSKDYYT